MDAVDDANRLPAAGSECLASETYSMKLLMEYQRLYGLDFLKKVRNIIIIIIIIAHLS